MRLRFLALALALPLAAAAQQAHDPDTAALDHGTLVVWIVHPRITTPGHGPASGTARVPGPMVPSAVTTATLPPNEIHEQTAGSFGTASSDVGTNAGDYGQPASTLGVAASTHGQTASTYGQTAGSFGTASSNVGQTAGSYGQTAGSFGESLSTIATAGQPKQPEVSTLHPARTWPGKFLIRPPDDLKLFVADVNIGDLAKQLARTANTAAAPDLLLGTPLPPEWSDAGLARRFAIVSLASDLWWAQHPRGDWGEPIFLAGIPDVAILRSAPHPSEARAFAVEMATCAQGTMLTSGAIHSGCLAGVRSARNTLEETALHAYTAMLSGGGFEPADPMAATFDTAATAATLLPHPEWYEPADTRIHTAIYSTVQRDGLAIVAMRGVLSANAGFGVVRGYAVLRPDSDNPGHWRVLALLPNVSAAQIESAQVLFDETVPRKASPAVTLTPVSLAAPSDADNRAPTPDLWWDAHPGAEMEVVEYQPGTADHWQAPRLLWVPDHNERERTRVTAGFAQSGSFRWRVWSIGPAGQTVLSNWRTFNIVR